MENDEALRFRILTDPLSFIHSLIQITNPFLCSFSEPGTVPYPREPAMSMPGKARALRAGDGTDHQQLAGVQGNEEDTESATFAVSVSVFIGVGGVQGLEN